MICLDRREASPVCSRHRWLRALSDSHATEATRRCDPAPAPDLEIRIGLLRDKSQIDRQWIASRSDEVDELWTSVRQVAARMHRPCRTEQSTSLALSREQNDHRLPVRQRVILRPPRISYWTGGFFCAPCFFCAHVVARSMILYREDSSALRILWLLLASSGWLLFARLLFV